MKERPILMNSFSVNAILDGRKTQTRRIIKPQPTALLTHESLGIWRNTMSMPGERFKCPYGKPGDRLWVRETWGYRGSSTGGIPNINVAHITYYADGIRRNVEFNSFEEMMKATPKQNIKHKSYCKDEYGEYSNCDCYYKWWRRKEKIPSIYMPQWASRITLEITDIRVERVQDITTEDQVKEGIKIKCIGDLGIIGVHDFENLWNSINEKRGYSWDSDPYVWVVEFRAI